MNRKKQLLSVFLGAAMLCCTACNSQGQTAASGTPQSISSTQNTAVSQYDGPLYELSFTNINDILPEFMSFYRSNVDSTANGEYYGIEFMTNFTLEDTITIGPHTYCDANLNFLPVGENRSFLDYYNGYRMFLWMNPDGEIRDGWALEVYDKDLNLVTTTADNYEIFCFEGGYIYLKTGWIPVQEKSTSLEGFFNIYTHEWHPLSSTSESLQNGGYAMGLINSASYYSDGLAYVTSSESSRVYRSSTNFKLPEHEVLGFIDESGEYAFRFDELSEFDGLVVNMVTGFYDGTCLVAARYDDDRTLVPMPLDDEDSPFYQVDFVFQIDKTGKILKEVPRGDFLETEEEVFRKNGQMSNSDKSSEWSYYTDSIRFADGLTLSVEHPMPVGEIVSANEVGGYTITDANGTVYSLDQYDVQRAIATDDGRVFLYCNKSIESVDGSASSSDAENTETKTEYTGIKVYQLNYKWIAPEEYVLPEEQTANLSAEGLEHYSDFQLRLASGFFLINDVTAASNPVLEIKFEAECTNYSVEPSQTVAQESAQCSYSILEHEYEALMRGGDENAGQTLYIDVLYLFSDPQFSKIDFIHSYNWTATYTWTDENNETHSKEIDSM